MGQGYWTSPFWGLEPLTQPLDEMWRRGLWGGEFESWIWLWSMPHDCGTVLVYLTGPKPFRAFFRMVFEALMKSRIKRIFQTYVFRKMQKKCGDLIWRFSLIWNPTRNLTQNEIKTKATIWAREEGARDSTDSGLVVVVGTNIMGPAVMPAVPCSKQMPGYLETEYRLGTGMSFFQCGRSIENIVMKKTEILKIGILHTNILDEILMGCFKFSLDAVMDFVLRQRKINLERERIWKIFG